MKKEKVWRDKMYQDFSGIYDTLMSEIPYDEWFEKLLGHMKSRGKDHGHVCELGCGTGEMTGRFSDAGYEVTGIDLSPDMLALAAQKKREDQNILYLNQDMTDFSLHKSADVVLCICDSLNYLLTEQELVQTFQCVRSGLKEDGIFVFDCKTEYCYTECIGNEIRCEDEENYTVIWDNWYDRETKINEYMLTMFFRQEDTGLYERHDECHRQRAYDRTVIERLLEQTGFRRYACMGADMQTEPGEKEERLYFVAG